ncbi:MAG: DUF1684 domain-containing protein [Vicinamibacterales bacterium]|nr:DUF1684 domain-containing protein [Vicinamibacterales bacterium]
MCGLSVVFMAVPAAQGPASTDATAAILASHKAIDESYARPVMSPFTAVAVKYFEPGQTARLQAGAAGVGFDAGSAQKDVVDLTLEGEAFWVTPVPGSAVPLMRGVSRDGEMPAGPGTPISSRVEIAQRQVISLGRYVIECVSHSQPRHVRVFDPEAAARKAYTGLKWFAPNPALQVRAVFVPNQAPSPITIGTSRGLRKDYFRSGTFEFVIDGKAQTLTALTVSATPKEGDDLFLAFRDATTGVETYEVGRYMTVRVGPPGAAYTLDFNGATNPLCNYSPHYNCPIPPRENVLTVPLRAGEMTYPKGH